VFWLPARSSAGLRTMLCLEPIRRCSAERMRQTCQTASRSRQEIHAEIRGCSGWVWLIDIELTGRALASNVPQPAGNRLCDVPDLHGFHHVGIPKLLCGARGPGAGRGAATCHLHVPYSECPPSQVWQYNVFFFGRPLCWLVVGLLIAPRFAMLLRSHRDRERATGGRPARLCDYTARVRYRLLPDLVRTRMSVPHASGG